MASKQIYFDGANTKNLSLLDPAMWSGTNIAPFSDSGDITTQKAYTSVGYAGRCVDLRAGAVAGMPWVLKSGDNVVAGTEDGIGSFAWLENLTDLLYLVEASRASVGTAYLYQVRNRGKKIDSLRWFASSTMTPVWDVASGLIGFERRLGAQTLQLSADDVAYFAMPNPYHETEPGPSPLSQALAEAGVLFNLNEFASAFFKRGAIRATILTYDGGIPADPQKEQLKSAWSRAMQGIKNAFGVEVFSAAVKPVTIGDGVGDLDNTDLTNEKREAISTALGVPHSMVMSNAANYATAEADRKNFYDLTAVPASTAIATVLNRSIFEPMGLEFEFQPQTLAIYQEDEEQRAQSFALYVGAGMKPSIAAELLGISLPEGTEYSDLDETAPAPAAAPVVDVVSAPEDEQDEPAKSADWQKEAGQLTKWVSRRVERGQTVYLDRFDAKHLSEDDKHNIAQEAGAAVDAPFPVMDWNAYP